jgi:hypothetical protein
MRPALAEVEVLNSDLRRRLSSLCHLSGVVHAAEVDPEEVSIKRFRQSRRREHKETEGHIPVLSSPS